LKRPYVAIVDDDSAFASYLRTFLSMRGYETRAYSRGDEMLASLKQGDPPDVVLLDVMMPGMNGLETLRALKAIKPDIRVIMLSGRQEATTIVEAVRLGAADYVVKPDNPEGLDEIALEAAIKNAIEKIKLVSEITELRRQLSDDQDRAFLFWGDSPEMKTIATMIEQVSDSDVTVLIRGESGVGKELVARAIHQQSPRKERPFVKVNCAALPAELLESELFGHEKGSFTGAHAQRRGRIELADGGTFFLDEVGELKPTLQAKLLRVLEERRFERLGGSTPLTVDVRWVAATNRDLRGMAHAGTWREDLYHRLAVFPIRLPPLRERREDILPLAESLLAQLSAAAGRSVSPRLDDLAKTRLRNETWSGNVRELRNVLERAMILTDGPVIRPEHLWIEASTAIPADALPETTDEGSLAGLERQTIQRTLAAVGGNRRLAATKLGIGLRTLYEKLKRYDLR
jgi:two-component system, NtrC family, response regulator AtoC